MESPVHLKEVKYHLDELVKLIQSQQDWISARPEVVPFDEVHKWLGDIYSIVGDVVVLNREMLFWWGRVIDQIPAETGTKIRELLDDQHRVLRDLGGHVANPPRSRPLP